MYPPPLSANSFDLDDPLLGTLRPWSLRRVDWGLVS